MNDLNIKAKTKTHFYLSELPKPILISHFTWLTNKPHNKSSTELSKDEQLTPCKGYS
jgi:hypothetical protein